MGLGDIIDDEDEESSSSARRYVRITRDEFEEFLLDREEDWIVVDENPHGEMAFETPDFMPTEKEVVLRLYSSLSKSDEKARDKGEDAIRLVIWHTEARKPLGGRKKTLRIKTWRKNLAEKIDSLMEDSREFVTICDECSDFMVKRDGQFGEFYGCLSYPDCEYSKDIDD